MAKMCNITEEISTCIERTKYDALEFLCAWDIARTSWTFTLANIQARFAKSGVNQLDYTRLLRTPCHLTASYPFTVATAGDIVRLLEQKHDKGRTNIELQPLVVRNGYVDTTVRVCLTSAQAMQAVNTRNHEDCARKIEGDRKEVGQRKKYEVHHSHTREGCTAAERAALDHRVRLYCVADATLCSLQVRREVEKRIHLAKVTNWYRSWTSGIYLHDFCTIQ